MRRLRQLWQILTTYTNVGVQGVILNIVCFRRSHPELFLEGLTPVPAELSQCLFNIELLSAQ